LHIPREEFVTAFLDNVRVRSRTFGGEYDSSASELKEPQLAVASDALPDLVHANSLRVADAIWAEGIGGGDTGPRVIRSRVEGWERIVNASLQPAGAPIYRTWTPPYTWWGPEEIEFVLDWFYARLSHMIASARDGIVSNAEVIAFADYMVDGEIHPFADGCGRVATALIMWLSLVLPSERLPRLRERDEHYAAIRTRDFCKHVRYFETLL
jgi:hypothetical protein